VEGVRDALSLVVLFLIAQFLYAQEKKPWNVDRLCGRLEHVQRTPGRHDPNTFSEKRKVLRDVSLSLYERRENEACCDGLNAVETTKTGRRGNFEFKTPKLGSYWLSTNWNGKISTVPIIYKPQKNPVTMCSEQGIQLDDQGNAEWWKTVTVD
jgi:hypothetical protein